MSTEPTADTSSTGQTTGDALPLVLVPLYKGVVYENADPVRWNTLVQLQSRVRDHVKMVGLQLELSESEGYAFLRSIPVDEDAEQLSSPRLVSRRALSFPVSLLLALLRKHMAEEDATGSATRLVLNREEIHDLLQLYLPTTSNAAKLTDQIDVHINKVVELGFLRKLKVKNSSGKDQPRYELMRIIKAFVDAQWLSGLDDRLQEYIESLQEQHTDNKDPGVLKT